MPKEVSEEDAEVIRKYLSSSVGSPEGRRKLAESMAAPLRRRLDYRSLACKILIEVMPEPCGACGRTDYDEGHGAGCRECSVRSTMGT